jgi:hypothetical protein
MRGLVASHSQTSPRSIAVFSSPRACWPLFVFSLVFLGLSALAQQAPPRIEGILREDLSGSPIEGASVVLLAPGLKPLAETTTDARGYFSFSNLEAGRYRVRAQKDRYVPRYYGEPLSALGVDAVAQSGQAFDASLSLVRAGTISGRVIAPDGQPLENAQVDLLLRRFGFNQERFLSPAAGVQPLRTIENGVFRFSALSPGDYYLKASAPGVRVETTLPTYYPGTLVNQAIPVTLRPEGTDVYNTDIRLLETPTFSISGRIVVPEQHRDAAKDSEVSFFLIPSRTSASALAEAPRPVQNRAPATDQFIVSGVLPGTYRLFAGFLGRKRGTPTLVGQIPISIVDENIENAVVTIDPGVTLEGKFVLSDPGGSPQDLSRFQLIINSFDGLPPLLGPTGSIILPFAEADGSFKVPYIAAGKYSFLVAGPQGTYLENAWLGPKNILGQPFDIDVSSRDSMRLEISAAGGRLEASVVNEANAPSPGATVVLIPPLQFRDDVSAYKVGVTNAEGKVILSGIRPGTYAAVALHQPENNAWMNSEYMSENAGAGIPVVISKGQQSQVTLKAPLKLQR